MKHPEALGFVREIKPSESSKAVKVVLQDNDYDGYGKRKIHVTLPRWDDLPFDVLDVISRKLDFADLFQFSRVCTNWRVFHKSIDKSKFLTSKEPLLLEFLIFPYKMPYSFTSLPNQKVYPLKKMMMNLWSSSDRSFPIYVTYSSGYFVMIADSSSFLLINPFTRKKKSDCNGLHVYRNNGWVTYCTEDDDDAVVDFAALNNIIYVVTDEPKIGVLRLDSPKIEYFRMNNSPGLDSNLSFFNLVKCDEELLLVRLNPSLHPLIMRGDPPPERKAYKIDLSTMTYVELETLGDIALFYVAFRSCKALINPNKWGYESNSVYKVYNSVRIKNPNCTVYDWDKKSEKCIVPPNPRKVGSVFGWCFIHPEI
ncbi:uncharacterized protein LOC131604195 [Vicia villosa]|uniref:uncharacterized protein LOC131604195 n=1 Tax=Vicia villosa TaxID=3911 RepID=UPI00273C1C45|nr:uncharacterized protein LOC131604195 [Vicia villosa]